MKIEVTDLTNLFLVIENVVNGRKIPTMQKPKWIRLLQTVAKAAYDIGKNGKADIDI